MKPCSNQRQFIALLALKELNDREAQELRAHLKSCEGCREYFDEMCTVTEKMAGVQDTSEIEASDDFHRKLAARLRAQEPAQRKTTRLLRDLFNWRVALPVTAVCVVLFIGLRAQRPVSNVRASAPTPTPVLRQFASARDAKSVVPPTVGNYQMAAEESLQKFDELLNQEAKQPAPPAPSYSASMLTLGDIAE